MIETIAKFITATMLFMEKAMDAGVNRYRERLKDSVELLKKAQAEIERLNKLVNEYSNELESIKKYMEK